MSGEKPDVRASDADRERVALQLRDHAAAGRLDPEEFETRIDAAYSARTVAELNALVHDLPAAVPDRSPSRAVARRRVQHRAGAGAITVLVCVAIWLAAGAHGSFWPVWVAVVWALALARDGWRTLGPGAELSDEQLGERRRSRHARRAERRGRLPRGD